MKKAVLILVAACLIITPAMAQEMQSIFSGEITSGGYAGPVVKLSDIDGETGTWIGLKGGWVINHSLVVGGAGYGLVNNIKETELDSLRTRRLAAGYGGLMLEYIYKPLKVVHLNGGVLIGAGGVGHHIKEAGDEENWTGDDGDAFFALEPHLGIEINVARHIRCELGASYLYTSGAELEDLEDDDLISPSGYIVLKFGRF